MRFPRCHHKIVGGRLLKHKPHRPYIVTGESPIPLRFQIAQVEEVLISPGNHPRRLRNLLRHEVLPAPRGLVIEQNPIAGMQPISLSVIHRGVIRECLRAAIWAPRMEWGGLRSEEHTSE